MQLKTEQIRMVEAQLADIRLNAQLRAEVVDHLCCQIEVAMNGGISYESALQKALQSWDRRQLRQLNNSILIAKYRSMLVRASALVAILAGVFFLRPDFNPVANAPLDIQPQTELPDPASSLSFTNLQQEIQRPTASPLRGVALTDAHSGFGMRRHPISKEMLFHKGIDLVAPLGTPVYATADGKVIFAGPNGDNGIQVLIAHQGGYTTVYNHLQGHNVRAGQIILQGVQIATVGSTGASTGPHLHYEIRRNDEAINPC